MLPLLGGMGSSPGWELRLHIPCDFAKKKKEKEILTHDPTWMSLEDIMLSEISVKYLSQYVLSCDDPIYMKYLERSNS